MAQTLGNCAGQCGGVLWQDASGKPDTCDNCLRIAAESRAKKGK